MKIKKYRPGFFTGFEEEIYEANSYEELMNCEVVKDAAEWGEICFSYPNYILVAFKGQGVCWGVIATIEPIEIENIKRVERWLPNLETVAKKLKSI